MKKSRFLSLLLSAVMAFSAIPMTSVGAADSDAPAKIEPATVLEYGENAFEGATNNKNNNLATISANSYLRVTAIAQKNHGIIVSLPDVTLDNNTVYTLTYKLRPHTVDKSSIYTGSATSYELTSAIGGGLRGFRSAINDINVLGAFTNGTVNATNGYNLSKGFGGEVSTKYAVWDDSKSVEGIAGAINGAINGKLPVSTSSISAADEEGWFTTTITFRTSNEHCSATDSNKNFLGHRTSNVKFSIVGGNGNGALDIAPFDVDDIVLSKADVQEVPEADANDVAGSIDANSATVSDGVIWSEDFEDMDAGELASGAKFSDNSAALTFSGSTNDGIPPARAYVAVDEEAFTRMHGWNSVTTQYGRDIEWTFKNNNVTLTPGTYELSGDFRLAGYNPGNVKALSAYTGDNANQQYYDVQKSHKDNWLELGVQLITPTKTGNYVNSDGTVGGGFQTLNDGQPFSYQDDRLFCYRIGGSVTSDMVGNTAPNGVKITEDMVDPDGYDPYDPNTWITMKSTIIVPEGQVLVLKGIKYRGGMKTAQAASTQAGIDLNKSIEHRNLAYDFKNLSLVRVDPDVYTEEIITSDNGYTFANVNDSFDITEDEGSWANASAVIRGNAENTYLSFYDRASSTTGIIVKFKDLTLPKGSYNYSYDVRLATSEDTDPTMKVYSALNSEENLYQWSDVITDEWETRYSWSVNSNVYQAPTALSDSYETPYIAFSGDSTKPFDIDNVVIYSFTDGVNKAYATIDFDEENYTIEYLDYDSAAQYEVVTETGTVIASDGTSATYEPADTVTLAPGKYELSGNFRLSAGNDERALGVTLTTDDDLTIPADNADELDVVTEVWTPLAYEFTVEETATLSAITLGADGDTKSFMADELTLTYIYAPPVVLTVTVDDTELNAGDTVNVTVKAVSNSDAPQSLNSLKFTLGYDKDSFELVEASFEADSELGGTATIDGDTFDWSIDAASDGTSISTQGTAVADAILRVKDTVNNGSKVRITLTDATAQLSDDPEELVPSVAASVAIQLRNVHDFEVKDKYEIIEVISGVNEDETVTNGIDVTFAVDIIDNPTVTVTIGGVDVTGGIETEPDGDDYILYTIPGNLITGKVVVTTKTESATYEFISRNNYGALQSGTMILLITADNNTVTYSMEGYGYNFYYCAHLGGYAAIIDDELERADIVSALKYEDGEDKDVIVNNGDIDGDTYVTAGDAALISEMIHNVAKGEDANAQYNDAMRLRADVYNTTTYTGNATHVTVSDAEYVLYMSVGANYPPQN